MVSHWDRHWVYYAGILGLVHERPKDDAAHASTVRKWSHGNIGPHWISSGLESPKTKIHRVRSHGLGDFLYRDGPGQRFQQLDTAGRAGKLL